MQGKFDLPPHATIPRSASDYLKIYRSEEDQHILDKRANTIGWSLLVLWVGIGLLANIGWGAGLLGAGIILLAIQAARKYVAMTWTGFWVVLAAFTMVFGLWLLLHLQPRFLPILCILTAAGLILSGVASRLRERSGNQG